jgi:spore coat polysaccharide biosynthesis protein SpsF (cytidylyltransferase family)/sialic acid synthase SpsE
MNPTYNILEVANVHGGSPDYVERLLAEFEHLRGPVGIKFQPFRYDRIAAPDFRSYELYKKLYFPPDAWKRFFNSARKTKDIWIDVFDEYSCEIAGENLPLLTGFKFQPSILYNEAVLARLAGLRLDDKTIILNISGIDEDAIPAVFDRFRRRLNPGVLILQVGFQSYPTEPGDAGLQKIGALRRRFPDHPLSFADHCAPDREEARFMPVLAAAMGAGFIEKHICCSGQPPEYDFQSAMDPSRYGSYFELLETCTRAMTGPFINEKERVYLARTIQVPMLNKPLRAGQIVDVRRDLDFRRSGRTGLKTHEIEELCRDHYILARDLAAGDVLRQEDFRKAVIAAVIICRLKSTRLPMKALQKIGKLASVETCIRGALRFKNIHHVILATSDLDEDAELGNHLYAPQVLFEKGHPDDLMARYLTVIDRHCIDVVVRATADMPYLSEEIFECLLSSHFATGADYTRPRTSAVGTSVSIINAEAFHRARLYFPNPEYSEYLTYYFINNPRHFRLNLVDLPPELVRDYRMTLDHQEDLDLFNRIEKHLDTEGLEPTAANIFRYLDGHPEVAGINRHLTLRYESDPDLVQKLKTYTVIPEGR